MSTTPHYDTLAARQLQLHRLGHLEAMASWDRDVYMPPAGNEARAAAMAELAMVQHRLRTDTAIDEALQRAGDEPLDDWQRANLREISRQRRRAQALPESLVARKTVATARCEHAWRSQRPNNDWRGFAPNLTEVFAVVREEAERLSDALDLAPYDALIDEHEPGVTSAQIERIFAPMRQWLPPLIDAVVARQAALPPLPTHFDIAAQQRLCAQVVDWLGFDFGAGRLDTTTHPFCGGVPEDVRLTTRYRTNDFLGSLTGTIHETGHGRYEQNLPRDWLGQPVAQARSMAVHESQSLMFEMQLAGHPGVVGALAPLVREAFGDHPAFTAPALHARITRCQPGCIRVDADEVSYPAHILLRFGIEQALLSRQAEVADIPALWDEGMQRLLGIDTRGNHTDGAMQDVHWPVGLVGYFPCYTLGAMLAAQCMAAIRRATPDLDAQLARGQLSAVFDWLREHIWSQGSRWTTSELIARATGEPLSAEPLRAHLTARYLAG